MKMKKIVLISLAFLISVFLFACKNGNKSNNSFNNNGTRIFVDSLDRNIEIKNNIDRVVVTGPLGQMFVFAIAPEKLVGLSNKFDDNTIGIIKEEYIKLPILGQLYGGKGTLNLETVLNVRPDVIIDVGENKNNLNDDMDDLSKKTGLPCVHIDFALNKIDECFNKLGDLLGNKEKAELILKYCNKVLNETNELMSKVDKKRVMYCIGIDGLNTIGKGTYFSEAIDMIAENVAVFENPSNKGTGNAIDLEKIISLNPEYIFFAEKSMYDNVDKMEDWKSISAIKNKKYYYVPQIPYNIMGFPPGIQKILGIRWETSILYKNNISFDIKEDFKEYYKLFYDCDLSDEQYDRITK